MGKHMQKKLSKRGPKPDTLKIEGDWKEAIQKALRKKYPDAGWPKEKKSTS